MGIRVGRLMFVFGSRNLRNLGCYWKMEGGMARGLCLVVRGWLGQMVFGGVGGVGLSLRVGCWVEKLRCIV